MTDDINRHVSYQSGKKAEMWSPQKGRTQNMITFQGGAPKLSQGVGLSAHTPAQGKAAMASPGYPLQSLTRWCNSFSIPQAGCCALHVAANEIAELRNCKLRRAQKQNGVTRLKPVIPIPFSLINTFYAPIETQNLHSFPVYTFLYRLIVTFAVD